MLEDDLKEWNEYKARRDTKRLKKETYVRNVDDPSNRQLLKIYRTGLMAVIWKNVDHTHEHRA